MVSPVRNVINITPDGSIYIDPEGRLLVRTRDRHFDTGVYIKSIGVWCGVFYRDQKIPFQTLGSLEECVQSIVQNIYRTNPELWDDG